MIKDFNQSNFSRYLEELSPNADKEYSLWKATKRLKRPVVRNSPLKNEFNQWIRRDEEKAELFAEHLFRTFQPHNIPSSMALMEDLMPNLQIKPVTPMEVAKEIERNLNPKKSAGVDKISPRILKELSKKGIVMLTYIFNACFRLEYVPQSFKIAKIIMLKKPDKAEEKVESYRPISILPAISKLFEKLLLKRLKPLARIPDHQFGFCNQHSTIEQVHRVAAIIEKAFEEKKYCSAAFLDVAQAFDRVWHEGLQSKLAEILPGNYVYFLKSYITGRAFRVFHGDAISTQHPINARVPQGSVLGPILYLIYTADIPTTEETETATFADDTAILSVHPSQAQATENLQKALDGISRWADQWKIKLNEQKSTHVTFAKRKCDVQYSVYIKQSEIPAASHAKYLGIHLDSSLTWRHHIDQKKTQINLKLRQMYWLIGHHSKMKIESKRLIYQMIIKPVWTYGIQLWGCAKPSNRKIIQTVQNKTLRTITGARWFQTNEALHKDLKIKWVDEVVREYATKHEKRLHGHINPEAFQLID
ncbi:unnamed protein product, partial [Allacma fusca]